MGQLVPRQAGPPLKHKNLIRSQRNKNQLQITLTTSQPLIQREKQMLRQPTQQGRRKTNPTERKRRQLRPMPLSYRMQQSRRPQKNRLRQKNHQQQTNKLILRRPLANSPTRTVTPAMSNMPKTHLMPVTLHQMVTRTKSG
jgi:hypothetical protein